MRTSNLEVTDITIEVAVNGLSGGGIATKGYINSTELVFLLDIVLQELLQDLIIFKDSLHIFHLRFQVRILYPIQLLAMEIVCLLQWHAVASRSIGL